MIDNESDNDCATVYRVDERSSGENLLKVWYNGIGAVHLDFVFFEPALETSSVVRERVADEFFRRVEPKSVLSDHLRGLRMELFDQNA